MWSDIPNIEAVPGEPIQSADWNNYRSDLSQNEFNAPRPISAGGTGATNAADARTNLQLPQLFDPVSLTPAQQGQARANIGAGVLSGFRNKLINGDFAITQRGGPFTVEGYTLDRWKLVPGSGSSNSVQRTNTAIGEIRNVGPYSLLWTRSVAGANSSAIQQFVEDVSTLSDGKATFTISANASAPTELIIGLQQFFGSSGSPSPTLTVPVASGSSGTLNVTTTMQKFNVVFDIPSIAGKTLGTGGNDALVLNIVRNSTATNPTATVRMRHASLVEGDAAAEADPFSPRHIQQELVLCQRYCRGATTYFGIATDTNKLAFSVNFGGVPLRAKPTLGRIINRGNVYGPGASVDEEILGLSSVNGTGESFDARGDVKTGASFVAGSPYIWRNGLVLWEAEL